MNEIRLANYTLMAVMFLTMATFCVSLNTLTKSSNMIKYQTNISITGYGY